LIAIPGTSIQFSNIFVYNVVMATTPAYDVFISYRRRGGSELAQIVRAELTKRGFRVFMDVRELSAGRFDAALKSSIEQATNFVLLLTPGCLDHGSAEDWYLSEINLALTAKRNIVPLKSADFEFPSATERSRTAALVSRLHCVTYVHEHSDASLDKLCHLLARPRTLDRRPMIAGLAIGAVILAGIVAWKLVGKTGHLPTPPSLSQASAPSNPDSIDLLQLIDRNRDTLKGTWLGSANGLIGQGGDKPFFIRLPWMPPSEYRLRLKVTRLGSMDKSPLSIGLSSASERFTLVIDHNQKEKFLTGLGLISGNDLDERRDRHPGRVLARNVPIELEVTVRASDVELRANGSLIYSWHGNLAHATRRYSYPTDPLVLGGGGGSFSFESIVLEPLGNDRGQPLEQANSDTK